MSLERGISPSLIPTATSFDISKTLDGFVIIVDSDGKIVASDAQIGSDSPIPPKGVFDYAANHEDNRLTWQPQKGVRLAIVVKKYSYNGTDGYVVVGRNMKEIETREDSIEKLVGAALLSSLMLSWFTIYLTKKIKD